MKAGPKLTLHHKNRLLKYSRNYMKMDWVGVEGEKWGKSDIC